MFKMDMRYTNGKIYKLVCNVTGDTYYGSTIQSLKRRLQKHKVDYKRYLQDKCRYITVFKILETGDYDIHLVEDYACLCRSQLEAIERIYIEGYTCINKVIPTRTNKEGMKEYRKENKEKLYKRAGEKIECKCGSKVRRGDIARHKRTKKHINYHN